MISWPRKKPKSEGSRRRHLVGSQDVLSGVGKPDVSTSTPAATDQPTGSQYRRNRTLSSYRYDTPEESVRHKAHHLAVQRRNIGGLLTITLSAVVLSGLLLWQLMVQIQVATSTKQLVTSFNGVAYEQVINDYLTINPAQRLRFALDIDALSSYVSSKLPEVDTLSLKGGLTGVAKGTFAITFRTPLAGWQMGGKQYFVDANGVVFETNYYQPPTVQIVDESGITPEQGTAVASGRLLGFLGRAVSLAQERGYAVNRAALPQGTTRTVDLYFDSLTTRARMTTDRGAGEQVEDFDRAYKHTQTNGIGAAYIDVRVGGRAVYK